MTVYLKNGSLKRKVELQSGDLLIVPRIEKYGFGTGTIDYFNYFKWFIISMAGVSLIGLAAEGNENVVLNDSEYTIF